MGKKNNLQTTLRNALLGLTIAGNLTLLASQHVTLFPLELLASQLPPILLCIGLAVFVGSLGSKRFSRLSIAALLIFGATFMHTRSLLQPTPQVQTKHTHSLRVATYNKLFNNQRPRDAIDYLDQSALDVVSLQEVSPDVISQFQADLNMPYTARTTSSASAFGSEIGFLSKHPIQTTDNIQLDGNMTVLRTVISVSELGNIAVYSVHIYPPFSPSDYTRSLQAIDSLSTIIANEQLPTIVAGDFNTTVFSPKLRRIQQHLQLASFEHIPACSWSFGSVCMRIDHVLYSDPFHLKSTDLGPASGSDHRPVVAVFSF